VKIRFNAVIHALRMRVERTFAWEDKFKRLLLRFERIQQRHYGMKLLAYTLINLRKFCGTYNSQPAKRERIFGLITLFGILWGEPWYGNNTNNSRRAHSGRPSGAGLCRASDQGSSLGDPWLSASPPPPESSLRSR